MAQQLQSGIGLLTVEISRLYTHKHTRQDSSERVISLLLRSLPVQQTQETNFRTRSGIQTRNWTATDLRLIPHGHRDR